MEDVINAITEQQARIIFRSEDCKSIEDHMRDADTITKLTMIKIMLRKNSII